MFDKQSLLQRLIYENWIEGTVEIISGAPVVCVDGLIQMKKKLGNEDLLRNAIADA